MRSAQTDIVANGGLSLDALSLTRRGLTLIDDLSLELPATETLAVMGPSGAGKTTLLRSIAGLTHEYQGLVTRPSDHVSVVFQDPRLVPWRTAIENVQLVCNPKDEELAFRWLDIVGLSDAAHLYPAQLSGGMRQRVAVARAFAHEAPLVLVDEPFASLDTDTSQMLRDELMTHLAQTHRTALWVTHSLEEAAAVSHKTLHLAGPPSGGWQLIDH